MADQTPRALLKSVLEPLLPDTWAVLEVQRIPDTIDRVTVVLKHVSIQPLPEAPLSWLEHSFLVTVADPHEDNEKAENALDAVVTELLAALDSSVAIKWTTAKKVLVRPDLPYLGWDIEMTMNTKQRESTP